MSLIINKRTAVHAASKGDLGGNKKGKNQEPLKGEQILLLPHQMYL